MESAVTQYELAVVVDAPRAGGALVGAVSDATAEQLCSGWSDLLGRGSKAPVERVRA